MTAAIRSDSTTKPASTRRPCRPLLVRTSVIVESNRLPMRSLVWSSPGCRREGQCSRGLRHEHRQKTPVFVPEAHPSIDFFAFAGHHGAACCVEVWWCKLPMCWSRAECLNELPETALTSMMNNC